MKRNDVEKRYDQLVREAEQTGYQLNPNREFCMDLAEGMLVNQERHGIEACPCRLVLGKKEENMDIVCPCVYREEDLAEYGACFCALYVADTYDDTRQVPERRLAKKDRQQKKTEKKSQPSGLSHSVWRCSVCGYLCALDQPPAKCPICGVGKERFEHFM